MRLDCCKQGYSNSAQLSIYCGFAKETDDEADAADKCITALEDLLKTCCFKRGCDLIDEKDYKKLINMINADSINYSLPKTLSSKEIADREHSLAMYVSLVI